jgi:hypothetical protein
LRGAPLLLEQIAHGWNLQLRESARNDPAGAVLTHVNTALTTGAYWSRSAISRRPRSKQSITQPRRTCCWRRCSSQTVSGKPGAVQNISRGSSVSIGSSIRHECH